MRRNLLLAIIATLCMPLLGNPVDETTARQLAQNFWKGNNIMGVKGDKVLKKRMDDAKFVNVALQCGYSEFFIFNNEKGKGFVIIAADDCMTPILGYSYDSNFATDNLPTNMKSWLDSYAEQIRTAVEMRATATDDIRADWECLRQGRNLPIRSETQVNPLITTTWGQGQYYNSMCPQDYSGPDGHAPTGCVATAMAQIMKYWSYPVHGVGSHSYTPQNHPEYGTQHADFSSTTYQWSSMADNVSSNDTAVATLMYHCGVSVEMDYGPDGSSALTTGVFPSAEQAYKTFFDYKSTLHSINKSDYSDSAWISILKAELDADRPIHYRGSGPDGGHSFICDGYNNSNYFHFNWGWGGNGDGDFLINNLNPTSNGYQFNFTSNQKAIIGIEPNNTTYNFELVYYSTPIMSDDEYWFYDDLSVYAEVVNIGNGDFSGYIGAGVYYEEIPGSNEYYFLDIMDRWDWSSNPLPSTYHCNGDLECAGGPPYIPGSYTVAMLYSMDGLYWNLIDPGSYDYAYFDIVYSSPLETNSDFTITTGDALYSNTYATINVDIWNYGNETFYGQFNISLLDYSGNWKQVINIHDCINGLQPNHHYNNGLDFTGLITVEPGTYLISLAYRQYGSSNWYYAGASDYQNPAWVYVAPEPIYADPYEPNNSQNLAYSFTPSFSGDSATVNTTGSNLHNSSDVDYYKISLDSGYDYTITPRLHDSSSSGNGDTYSVDAMFAYSTDGVNWSDFYDDIMTGDFSVVDGDTLYFDVISKFEGDVGTYLLSIDITRTQHIYSYTISVLANPIEGGSVTGEGTYEQGQTCTVNAIANEGYTFINWTEDSTEVSTDTIYIFEVIGNRNLVANFQAQPQQYTISVSANPSNGGNVTGGGTYQQDQTCTISASPNSGYDFVNWTEDGTQVSTDANYTFTVIENRNLVANFVQITHIIQATAGANGIISPSGTITVTHGADQSFVMIPDEGYEVQDVHVDGNSVGATTSYTFSNVTTDHDIHVTFVHVDGVEESSNISAVVYPNPTTGIVNIKCNMSGQINVFNALGQLLISQSTDGNGQETIDMSNFPNGLYLIQLISQKGMSTRQIIKIQ